MWIGTITLPSSADASEPWNLQFERLHFDVAPEPEDAATATPAGEDRAPGDSQTPGDPRAIPALNFHAADLDLGRAAVRRRASDSGQAGRRHQPEAADRRRRQFQCERDRRVARQGCRAGPHRGHADQQRRSEHAEGTGLHPGHRGQDRTHGFRPELGRCADRRCPRARRRDTCSCRWTRGKSSDSSRAPAGYWASPALPRCARRLALDFSDLTDKGLAFDTVRGDFDLRDGNAYTDNVLVKGPAAEIGLNWAGRLEKQGLRPNCSGNGQRRQFAAAGGLGGRARGGGGGASFHPSVQTAAERPGARVLSNYGQLG